MLVDFLSPGKYTLILAGLCLIVGTHFSALLLSSRGSACFRVSSCFVLSGLCIVGKGYEQSCLEAINGSNPIISGYTELARRPLEESGRDCDYFTVMRHPIDRLVSAFFYCPPYDPQIRPKKWWVARGCC